MSRHFLDSHQAVINFLFIAEPLRLKAFSVLFFFLVIIAINLNYLLFDEFSCSLLKPYVEDGEQERVPEDVAHAQASQEKVPSRR